MSSITLTPIPASSDAKDGGLQIKCSQVRSRSSSGNPVSGQWQDLSFLTTGIPIRPFQADITIFLDASTQGWGAHMGDSQILGTWAPTGRRLYINCLELKVVMLLLHHEAPVLHGCQVMIATGNTMVVSYINKQGGTQLPLPATSSSRANPVASVPEHSHKGQTHCGLSKCDS